jgi:hypothetical protein
MITITKMMMTSTPMMVPISPLFTERPPLQLCGLPDGEPTESMACDCTEKIVGGGGDTRDRLGSASTR